MSKPGTASESVNDRHSALNPTIVARRIEPRCIDAVVLGVKQARERGQPLAIAGARHAMGGQQFLSGGTLLDMRSLNRVRRFDAERGLIEVEAGITWPDVMRGYLVPQAGLPQAWGIRQKQTGADRLTIGGAISANIHGRGLAAQPFAADVESIELVTAQGEVVRCSREHRRELFRSVVGGYGLFGIITAATLRLVPRQKVERVVRIIDLEELMMAFEERIAAGFLYGDFQFSTAPDSDAFLRTGVLSCYRAVDSQRPVPRERRRLSLADWNRLLMLAHKDKSAAFERFASFYMATSGQLYWSDTHQLNIYLEDYHGELDRRLGARLQGSEMITELYVPRSRLVAFMDDVRRDFLQHGTNFIYGTIRLIEKDAESALPWASESWACVIVNLHVDHRVEDIDRAAAAFRRLIDHAIAHQGSYYLTYHRYARADQVETCHPGMRGFLRTKAQADPDGILQSDWYRHMRSLLATAPA